MTTPAMSPRASPHTGRHPVSPTSTGGYESQEEDVMGFRRVPLLNDVEKGCVGSHSCLKRGQKRGEDSWSSQYPPSSPSAQSIGTKSTSTTAQVFHSRNESFEIPPIPGMHGMGGLKNQGKEFSPHERPSTAPLILTAAVSPLEMNENALRRKSADFVSGNLSRHHRSHPQSQSLDWSNHNSYFGTAQWVFGQNNSGNSDVYKSFVNFLDQNSPRTKQECEANETASHDAGCEEDLDVVDDLVVPPAPKSLETSTKSIIQRKEELSDALGTLHLTSGDAGENKTPLGLSLASTLAKDKEETGRKSLQLDSPFASVTDVGINFMEESNRTGSSDVFSFPVKSCQVEAQETVAPLFGVGSWPSFHTANASQSPSCHNVEYYSTDEDAITEAPSTENNAKAYSGISIPGRKSVDMPGSQEQLVPVGSPNPMKLAMQEEKFDPSLYSYDEGYITSEYEEIALTVLHRRGGTGFEYLRELPLKTNDLIAGRYQIADFLGQAAFSRAVQALDLKTGQYVCLKVVKNDKDYFDQSLDEIKVLRYVNACDPGDHYRIVRLLDYLYFKEHLILVTELLRANLYEFSKYDSASQEDTYFIPTRLKAMAVQMLEAVCFLHSLSLIHADLKPENILVKSYSQCEIKLIDLGSAFFDSDPRASFVQSWSYRAPEVMLGLPYSFGIDIWSIGCILVELAVGRVLFRETTCPQMLASMESVLGPFPSTLTLDGKYSKNYFLNDGRIFENNPDTVRCIGSFFFPSLCWYLAIFLRREANDPYAHNNIVLQGGIDILKPKSSNLATILDSFDPTMVDFVEKLLALDPDKRYTAEEALQHPWLSSI